MFQLKKRCSFFKVSRTDIILGPEMKSTGEVMGIADSFDMHFLRVG